MLKTATLPLAKAPDRLAETAFYRLCNTPWEALYLQYRPSAPGEAGTLAITADTWRPGANWKIALPTRIPCSATRDQMAALIRAATWNLPILDPEAIDEEPIVQILTAVAAVDDEASPANVSAGIARPAATGA